MAWRNRWTGLALLAVLIAWAQPAAVHGGSMASTISETGDAQPACALPADAELADEVRQMAAHEVPEAQVDLCEPASTSGEVVERVGETAALGALG